MSDRADDGDRFALFFFDANVYLRMRNEPVCLEYLSNLLLDLNFREAGYHEPDGKEWKADRSSLANTHFTRKLSHIKNFDSYQIPAADDVLSGGYARSGGQRFDAVVCLLRCFEYGLRATGRRQYQYPKQSGSDETP